MVITNDAAIPTHLGHDSTATPVKWRYSHYVFVLACVCVCVKVCNIYMCARLRVCVSVLVSIISPLQVQDFFTHRAFCCAVVMHVSARVCLCVQRYLHNCKHSTPLFDYIRRSFLTSALNHANFLQIQHYSTIADKTGSLPQ